MPARKRNSSDGEFVRACRRGEAGAWDRLIRRYRRLIYSIPLAYRLPRDRADEIFQEVTVKLFENLGKLRKESSVGAWLSITTRRACQAMLRGERLETDAAQGEDLAAPSDPDLADRLHLVECEHTLALALERLDTSCRSLLESLYFETPPPSYRELADRLKRPIGSLGPTRSRCLRKLRKLYLELGGSEP